MKIGDFFTVDKEWLESLDYSDKEMVMLRAKLDARSYLLRLSVALNTGLLAGLIVNIVVHLI